MKDYEPNSNLIQFPGDNDQGAVPLDNSEKQSAGGAIIPLPSELVNYRNKNFLGAVMLFAIGISICLFVHEWTPIFLFAFFAVYFVFRGLMVAKKYRDGVIVEIVATCTGLKTATYRDRITVTFAAPSESGSLVYYKFIVPSRKAEEDFIVSATYAIYFDQYSPHALIGCVQVGKEINLIDEDI